MSERVVSVESNGRLSWSRPAPERAEITISGSTYIVVEEAVYRHTIFGPFASEAQAQEAVAALDAVSDKHHEYRVYRLEGHV